MTIHEELELAEAEIERQNSAFPELLSVCESLIYTFPDLGERLGANDGDLAAALESVRKPKGGAS